MSKKDRRNSISFSTSSLNLDHKSAKYKSRKTQFTNSVSDREDEESRDPNQTLFDTLMNDPTKRKLVMQLLSSQKNEIEEYKRQEELKNRVCASPISKVQRRQMLESPTALLRRRAIESPTALLRRRAIEQRNIQNSSPVSTTSSASSTEPISVPYENLLQGVKAFVDVRSKNIDRSAAVNALLKSMGAEVADVFTNDVTHVIFKDGTFPTYHRAKLTKKCLVSILWLEATRTSKCRQPEKNFPALGVSAFEQDASMLCDKFQKEYKSLVKDEIRRSLAVVPETPSPQKKLSQSLNKASFQSEDDIIPSSQKEELASTISGITSRLDSRNDESDMESNSGIIDGRTYNDEKCVVLTESKSDNNSYKKKLRRTLYGHNNSKEELFNKVNDNNNTKCNPSTSIHELNNDTNLNIANLENIDVIPIPGNKSKLSKLSDNSLSEQLTRFVTVRKKKHELNSNLDKNKETDVPRKRLSYSDSVTNIVNISSEPCFDLLNSLSTKKELTETISSSFSLRMSDESSIENKSKTTKNETKTNESDSISKNISEMSSILITNLPTSKFISKIKDKSGIKEACDHVEAGPSNVKSSLETKRKSSLDKKDESIETVKDSESSTTKSSLEPKQKSELENRDVSIEAVKDSESSTRKSSLESKQKSDLENRDVSIETVKDSSEPKQISVLENKKDMSGNSESSIRKTLLEDKRKSKRRTRIPLKYQNSETEKESLNKTGTKSRRKMSVSVNEDSPPKQQKLDNVDLENKKRSSVRTTTRKTESILNNKNIEKSNSCNSTNINKSEIGSSSNPSCSELSSDDSAGNRSKVKKRKLYNPNQSFDENLIKQVEEENMKDISKRRENKKPLQPLPKLVLTENAKRMMKQTIRLPSSCEEDSSTEEDSILPNLLNEIAVPKKPKNKPRTKKIIVNEDLDEQKVLLKEFEKVLGRNIDTPESPQRKSPRNKVNKVVPKAIKTVVPFKTPQGIPKRALKRALSQSAAKSPIKPALNRRSSLEFMPRNFYDKKSQKQVKKPTIVCTRFHRDEIKRCTEIVGKLGRFEVESNVSDRTTHLVVGEPVRTVNILRAIGRGLWLVKKEWLFSSGEKQAWLPEDDFELVDFSPAVQKSRIQRESFGPKYPMDIFANCGTIHIVKTAHPKCSELEELVRICKGSVVTTARKANIVVGEHLRYEEKSYVKEAWILDSITQNKKLNLSLYAITPKENNPQENRSENF